MFVECICLTLRNLSCLVFEKVNVDRNTQNRREGGVETGFAELGLSQQSLNTLEQIGYHTPSPIQKAFIPLALKGVDCTGQARTGTGKTAAFVLPIIEAIDLKDPSTQALVLAPTRELSEQVAGEAQKLCGKSRCTAAVFVGGRPIRQQLDQLKRGVQIAVGTPGRVIDLLSRRALDLRNLKIVVLDEADRMLDIGFRPDIEKILRQCPTERQTLLLSATMPPPVERLAKRYMRDPQRVDLSEDSISSADTIDQYYATVDYDRKFQLLVRILKKAPAAGAGFHADQTRSRAVAPQVRGQTGPRVNDERRPAPTQARQRDEKVSQRRNSHADRHRCRGPGHRCEFHLAHHQLRHSRILR